MLVSPCTRQRVPFYSACRDQILLFWPSTIFIWSGCTCRPPLVCLCATPHRQTKENYFVCLSAVAPFPAMVWVSFLSLSLMACMIITWGRPDPKEVANIANKSAWEFWPLGIYLMENASKLDWAYLTLMRYPSIRWSLAPNSPLTCLTTSLESEKTSTTFPPRDRRASCRERVCT